MKEKNEVKMKVDNELKNFWNDKEKVKRAEEKILKEESERIIKKPIKNDYIEKNDFNENINFNSSNLNKNINFAEERKSKAPIIILIILFIISIIMTYFVYEKIKKAEEENIKAQQIIEYQRQLREAQKQNQVKQINTYYQNNRTTMKLDGNMYSNNFYNIEYSINNYYQDREFTKNLEAIFNTLTNINIKNTNEVYEFEFKGLMSRFGDFTYIPYRKTNNTEYNEAIFKELNRFKNIKFREQSKDVSFSFTLTNKYQLIR
jgi:cbb3-type cytochrome oxidase subunit 3